jgi:Fe-S oxidoreductase/nitrate reductase gamma subunit
LWKKVSHIEASPSSDDLGKRLWLLLVDGLLQRRLLKEYYPGLMHAFILWGFVVLFLGTVTIAIQDDMTRPLWDLVLLKGWFYLFYKLALNLAGLLALSGVVMALVRRYIVRPSRLSRSPENGIVLIWILIILVTGFTLEGLRIYSLKNRWEAWSLGGWIVARGLSGLQIQVSSAILTHKIAWWFHLAVSFGFIAYVPFSRLRHLLTSTANIFVRGMAPQSALSPIVSFDPSGPFGVSRVEDFTSRQILEFDACTQCGRCQDSCPAHLSEKPLSPKSVIETLKAEWLETGRLLRKRNGAGIEKRREEKDADNRVLVDEDAIWSCTMCMACLESCPVYISPFDKLVDLRRDLVMARSRFFPEIATLFRDVERFGDAFGRGRAFREDWSIGLNVRTVSAGDQVDLLLWVGCHGAFHDRVRMVVSVLVNLFKKAGIDYGVLGTDEQCCGDPIRRIGDEYLFQKIAISNIALLQGVDFKRIVAYCPHCLNMLKNEYPQFGGTFEVVHYTELLGDLLSRGDLKVTKEKTGRAVYHDPCYLARGNGIYQGPRRILRSIPGMKLLEAERSKRDTFCCGAGGGHLWMRELPGKKINEVRVQELIKGGHETIVTSCPYCLIMLEDGVKSLKLDGIRCEDIAEILGYAT